MLPDWKDPALTAEQKLAIMEPERLNRASATKLATLFRNASRNSVIGLLVRRKVPLLGQPAKAVPDYRERQRQMTQARVTRAAKENVPLAPRHAPPTAPRSIVDDIPLAQRKTLLQLSDKTCKWPEGDPLEPGFHFCGAVPLDGKPYCKTHDKRASYVPQAE